MEPVESRQYKTMAEIAFLTIKDAVLDGRYPPGFRLIPAKMEAELKLGRIAIREALKELSGLGMVVSVPNKGFSAAYPPPVEEIRQIFEIRFLLEGKAGFLATENITDECIRELEELHQRMLNIEGSNDEYFRLNKEFHLKIYGFSKWEYLVQIITQLIEKVKIFRNYYPGETDDFPGFNDEHSQILTALKERNAQQVSDLIVTNIRSGFKTLLNRKMIKQKNNTDVKRTQDA
ncbi:MAG: GntR family transcriptional regulator [Desulfarculaceae bacterium]|jgi:DNA-binding GntR family transcriptional regulator